MMNLAFHTANVVLLYFVLLGMSGFRWRSAAVAALFALHPLQVDTVAWIAERKNVLSTLFWLLTLLAYLRYARKPDRARYSLVFILYALGLMSKPMLVTIPCVLLLFDFWPLRRIDAPWALAAVSGDNTPVFVRTKPARLIIEKLPLFALALISGIITIIGHQRLGLIVTTAKLPLPQRFATAAASYCAYLKKTFWPADLAVFYPIPQHRPLVDILVAVCVLAVVTVVVVKLLRRAPYLGVGWFWFLGTLVPVIGILQVSDQAMADRWAYVPLIGIFIMLVWGLSDLLGGRRYGKEILSALSAAVLLTLAVVTHRQLGYWQNTTTLFQHALDVTENNVAAHNALGDELYKQGKWPESEVEFRKALQIAPNFPTALSGLGLLAAREGDKAKAIGYFNTVLQKNPGYSDAHYELGNIYAAQGKFAEAAEHYALSLREKPDSADAHNNLGVMDLRLGKPQAAIDEFKAALNIKSDFPEAHVHLGDALSELNRPEVAKTHYAEAVRQKPDFAYAHLRLGLGFAQSGDLDEAIAEFLTVTKLEPTNAMVYNHLGKVFVAQNRLDNAAKAFAKAVQLDPANADFQARLATTLAYQGKTAEAVTVYQDALRLKPDSPAALRNLAWILATNPKPEIRNGAEAVKLAEHVNALLPKPEPTYLEVLDAAYAEAGRFDDAIKTAEKVRQLCTNDQQKIIADRAGKRLELYKAGKPFHETGP